MGFAEYVPLGRSEILGWLPLPPGQLVDAEGELEVVGCVALAEGRAVEVPRGPLSLGRDATGVGTCAVGTTAVPGAVVVGITPVGIVAVGATVPTRPGISAVGLTAVPGGVTVGCTPVGIVAVGSTAVGRGRVVVGRVVVGRVVVGRAVVVVGRAVVVVGRAVVVVGLAVDVVAGDAERDVVAVADGVLQLPVTVSVTVTVTVGVGVLTWTVGSSPGNVAAVGSTVAGWVSAVGNSAGSVVTSAVTCCTATSVVTTTFALSVLLVPQPPRANAPSAIHGIVRETDFIKSSYIARETGQASNSLVSLVLTLGVFSEDTMPTRSLCWCVLL